MDELKKLAAITAKTWVEVENTYLTNQPAILRPAGRGRGRRYERVPDPDRPPTEAYLWAWKCTRTTRGVNRRRYLHTLRASSEQELNEQLAELFERDDVILIAEQRPEYASYRGDPQRLCEPAGFCGDRERVPRAGGMPEVRS